MMRIAWAPCYAHPLPIDHRFPMIKYELLPKQLLHEGTVTEEAFFEPEPISEKEILEIHDAVYWERLSQGLLTPREQRKTGFPHSHELIHRERVIMQGTIDAAELALEIGVAFNIAGGTHHAFTNRGEGFCLLNDIALGANRLLRTNKAKRIAVIDVDVHQGNGTAEIFTDEPRVFTLSLHGQSNYPLQKEVSDLDIGLPDLVEDDEYLKQLNRGLEVVFEEFKPDFVFFQSGVDILATDKLGRMAVTLEGCKERDRLILQKSKDLGIPVCASMGGGYSPDIKHIVEAHANTYRLANDIYF